MNLVSVTWCLPFISRFVILFRVGAHGSAAIEMDRVIINNSPRMALGAQSGGGTDHIGHYLGNPR